MPTLEATMSATEQLMNYAHSLPDLYRTIFWTFRALSRDANRVTI
ncbi:MAG TPA: hypothetical protein VGL71_04995 [Urbifossiella sp.]|jgi:hypothetical protein